MASPFCFTQITVIKNILIAQHLHLVEAAWIGQNHLIFRMDDLIDKTAVDSELLSEDFTYPLVYFIQSVIFLNDLFKDRQVVDRLHQAVKL